MVKKETGPSPADYLYNSQEYEEALVVYQRVLDDYSDSEVAEKIPDKLKDLNETIAYLEYEKGYNLFDQAKETAMRAGETLKPDEEFKKESESSAKDNIKSVLLLEAVGKKENIEVSDSDVKNAVDEIAHRNNMKPEELMKLYSVREGSLDSMKSRLFADKVMDFLLEKATIKS